MGMQFPWRSRLLGARLACESFCSKKYKTLTPSSFLHFVKIKPSIVKAKLTCMPDISSALWQESRHMTP